MCIRDSGIHASPTCVMMFGENEGALGLLVGEPNRGLEYMFVMMNAARLSVGLEGYAQGERAFQQAAEWARTRVQGKPPVSIKKVAGSASMGCLLYTSDAADERSSVDLGG